MDSRDCPIGVNVKRNRRESILEHLEIKKHWHTVCLITHIFIEDDPDTCPKPNEKRIQSMKSPLLKPIVTFVMFVNQELTFQSPNV
jgi:hypothetical protein